jgi:hypothetical protein
MHSQCWACMRASAALRLVGGSDAGVWYGLACEDYRAGDIRPAVPQMQKLAADSRERLRWWPSPWPWIVSGSVHVILTVIQCLPGQAGSRRLRLCRR